MEFATSIYHVRNGKLYYKMAMALLQYDLVSKKISLVSDDVECAAFIGDDVYLIEHASRDFSIYRQSLVTGERELVRGSGVSMHQIKDLSTVTWCDNLIALRGELYYTTRYPARLFKYGQADELIADFSDTSDGQLWSSHTDGRRIYCYYRNDGIAYVYMYDPSEGEGRLFAEAGE